MWTTLLLILLILPHIDSLSKPLSRRNAIQIATGVSLGAPPLYVSNAADDTSVDMGAIKAARSKVGGISKQAVVPIKDPPPLLTIRGAKKEGTIKIPRVGYSFYKTPQDQIARCTSLALLAGVRHFDVASQYGTNQEISMPLKRYLDIGVSGISVKDEKPELIQLLDATRKMGEQHARDTGGLGFPASLAPPPDGSIGRRGRRDSLFLHYKLSNAEQSTDLTAVKRTVKNAISQLGCTYLDMVSLHSPLTSSEKRLATYEALLELRNAGFIKCVGACNHGLGPLREIEAAGLELPAMNQLELSPFNTHDDIVTWCSQNGISIGCATWSKLSSTQAIQDAWLDVVGDIAKTKSCTKAQVLIRWSMQKGYICVPRSAAATKIERIAIAENTYGGVSGFLLSQGEMNALDNLNVSLKAGTLGRRDGWEDSDVSGEDWDPTDYA